MTRAVDIRSAEQLATGGAWISASIECTKPGITKMVTLTSAVGFVLAAAGSPSTSLLSLSFAFVAAMAGTALAASGANALNMWLEGRVDAHMERTRARPIPSGRMTPASVLGLGALSAVLGVLVLLPLAGPAAALVALATVALYVFAYTPSKTRTPWSTLIGAVPGAAPPMIGAAAAAHAAGATVTQAAFHPAGLALFVLMAAWQIPHFLAIAAMHREDYARAGVRVLPVLDRTGGRLTGWVTLASAVVMVPAAVLPAVALPETLGLPYVIVAALASAMLIAAAAKAALVRTTAAMRTAFFASLIHLSLLLLAATVEAAIRALVA